jgi:hypothetical protein
LLVEKVVVIAIQVRDWEVEIESRGGCVISRLREPREDRTQPCTASAKRAKRKARTNADKW